MQALTMCRRLLSSSLRDVAGGEPPLLQVLLMVVLSGVVVVTLHQEGPSGGCPVPHHVVRFSTTDRGQHRDAPQGQGVVADPGGRYTQEMSLPEAISRRVTGPLCTTAGT